MLNFCSLKLRFSRIWLSEWFYHTAPECQHPILASAIKSAHLQSASHHGCEPLQFRKLFLGTMLSEVPFQFDFFSQFSGCVAWSLRDFQRWAAQFQRFDVFRRCSALMQWTWKIPAIVSAVSELFSAGFLSSENRFFSADFLWNSSDIYTRGRENRNIRT